MDREVASAVYLAVALMLLASLIGIVMWTVYVGNDLKRDIFGEAVKLQHGLGASYLESLRGQENSVMAKASLYYIVAKEYSNIEEVEYGGLRYTVKSNNLWGHSAEGEFYFPEDIIAQDNLGGKVIVTVIKTDSDKFKIVVGSR